VGEEIKKVKQLTIHDLQSMKDRGEKIVMVNAYDYNTAQIVEEAGVDLVALGGALSSMILAGERTSLRASMEDVLFMLERVAPAINHAVLIAAMPYGSYHVSNQQAISNAIRLMKAGAHTVKMQGTGVILDRLKSVIDAGIPCMGHVGLTPQYIHKLGGYRAFGKVNEEAVKVYDDVKQLEEVGVWAIEMECVPEKVAAEICTRTKIPIFGIGSGIGTDGQTLAIHDIWGFQRTIAPKMAKRYVDLWPLCVNAIKEYAEEVRGGAFPTEANSFKISESEFVKFMNYLEDNASSG
jgi:3-methyl-2-oxobutanoate hydroxymethyltransferase